MGMIDDVRDNTAQLLDVRGEDEWNSGHAKDAVHISVDRIMAGKVDELDLTKPVYVYCASGGRARMAAKYLSKSGFRAENIGGLRNWVSAGGEVA